MRAFRGLSRTALAGAVLGGLVTVGAVTLLGGGGALAAANDLVVTGAGAGSPNVRTFGPNGADGGTNFLANGNNGTRVAAGDINGDGVSEIVTGTGPGVNAQVQVWSGDGKTLIAQANPFPGFTGGIYVAAANEDETAAHEIIVSAGAGGGPHVKVMRLTGNQLQDIYGFYAYDPKFTGGVFVAASGGRIITGPGAGGGPHVRVFRIFGGQITVPNEWMAYAPAFTGGVHVAVGAVRNSAAFDVVTGAGSGGGPHVKLFSLEGAEGPGFMAYDPAFRGGARVAVGMNQHLITGAGAGGGPHVLIRKFKADDSSFPVAAGFMAYAPTFTGGVWVGGFLTSPVPPTTTTSCVGIPPLCLPGGEDTTTTTAPATTTTTAGGTSTTSTSTTGPTTTTSTSTSTTSTTSTSTTSTTTPGTTTTTEAGLPLP